MADMDDHVVACGHVIYESERNPAFDATEIDERPVVLQDFDNSDRHGKAHGLNLGNQQRSAIR
jgi:hypothetical protein